MTDLKHQLRAFITETFLFGVEEPFADGDSLMENGIVDSTGVLELIEFLEDKLHVPVSDDELVPENLDSIDNLVAFIDRKHCVPLLACPAVPVEPGKSALLDKPAVAPGAPIHAETGRSDDAAR